MASPPAFIFVPGGWHTKDIYTQVIEFLQKDHDPCPGTLALTTQTVQNPYTARYVDDLAAIRGHLEQLIEKDGRDVILVGHSVTGLTVSDAAKGFSRAERQSQGKKGGIARMVYLAALVMPEGFQCQAEIKPGLSEEWRRLDEERSTYYVTDEDARAIFYNDLSPDEATKWCGQLRPMAADVFVAKLGYAAWREIPSTLVMGALDKTSLTPELFQFMIQQEGPNCLDQVVTCETGGHMMMISHPEWLADVLAKAAKS